MSDIPRSPELFFGQYVPQQIERLKGRLGPLSSPGAVVFELTDGDAWSLSLERGALRVAKSAVPDPFVRISVSSADFEPVIVAGAEHLGADAAIEQRLVAARVLTIDADRVRMLRDAPGTIALKLAGSGGVSHRLVVTLGAQAPKLHAPDCEIACALEDLWAIQSGTRNAFELLMDGKLLLTGKVELAMALGAALG